jgi:predicted ATP-grasp superfamily ATP-dependent carboligase
MSFIQANLQHSTAASRNLSRTGSVKGIDMALLQEPWYREGRIRGLNITGYTFFSASGTDRPRACTLMRNETAWMLPGFSCRDLVAILIKYNMEGQNDA